MIIIIWLRAVFFSLFLFPVYTFFFSAVSAISYFITGKRTLADWASASWAQVSVNLLSFKLVETGKENIPTGGCLFLFNHTSIVDIFVLKASLRKLRFGAKIELFKIPVFGLAMRAAGMLPIARDRRDTVIKVYDEAVERARNGEIFALAPEGKRNSEEKLLPFKSGPFIFAIKAGIPIVPVVIRGAQKAWPRRNIFPMTEHLTLEIYLDFLPAVETKDIDLSNRHQLMDATRARMLEFF